ncbi:DUF2164 domain-containing protein [Sediminibacillus massiliensis]|uniref:DUF2164 domain-containing protein n=1 Tax=Sediminibacillus massiliensis TaxID=1926277 RepID=UPI00098867E4|nr:DUF2164 domain-containing protein [Sediminibacillus massiliensis]
MKPDFQLKQERKEEMIGKIKEYFEKERDEELGELAAGLFLDFITEELGPVFYNIGVEDSHAFIHAKLEDIFEIQK